MTGTIGMMTEGGARRVAQEEVVVEVVEAMVERMDGRPCPHVWPVGHSMRRLTLTSSGTSSSPPSWMLTVCPLVLPSPVEEEGLVLGAGAARVPRLAGRSRQQICRTDLLGWSRGSQSAKTSRQEQTTNMQNRFAGLEQSESGPPQSYDGRSSGGRFGRQNSQQGGYGGRNSRGGSGENDRAKAIQAVRDFGGNRSQSVMGPHPTVSRENSAPRSASMVVQKKPEVPEVPLGGAATASMDDLEKWP